MSFRASKKGSGYLYERDKLTTREQRTFLHVNETHCTQLTSSDVVTVET